MRRMGVLPWLALGALVVACSPPTPEQRLIRDAADALGGEDRIAAVRTIVMEGEGTQYNLGQDLTPDASDQTFAVTAYRRAIDVAGGRARTELTREPRFTYFQGPAPQRQVQGVDGQVGYNVAPNGTATRIPDRAAADRRAEIYHHPIAAVRAALDPAARLSGAHTEASESLVDVTTPGGTSFTLVLDAGSLLPLRVVSMTDNTNLGDVAISTTFADYRDVGGLQVPMRLTVRTDDFVTADLRLASAAVDADAGDLAAPPAAAAAPAISGPPPATVAEERLAPGVWYLAGGSHHSVLVEFIDHLMLIEAPQNDARSRAVITRARALAPGKPLTRVVNTHHHFDHSGGLRAAISEGLTVVTHRGNAAFVEAISKRPHTIVPDALAMRPQAAAVETVGPEGREYTDGSTTVQLFPVEGSHSSTMIVAYLPAQRLLVQADLYNPGGVQMFSGALLEAIKARSLRVDRVVPLHGTAVPYAQFVKEATAGADAATD